MEEEEAARTERGKFDRAVNLLVILHVSRFENIVTSLTLREGNRITLGMIVVPIEVRAVLFFISVGSVTPITCEVDQIRIIGTILITVSYTSEAEVEEIFLFNCLD